MQYLIIITLVVLSGLFSGLNLGLLSLDIHELKRKTELGDEKAKAVLPVREKGNLLLCTLLLGNVAVNSALAIFTADISSGLIGGIVSTSLIVVFGEIIPQSYISRYALEVGAKTAPITKFFIFIFFPLAWPLAYLLDKILGEELPTTWSHDELKAIIRDHEDDPNSKLDEDEEQIIIGALTFSDKHAKDIMTPRTVTYYLNSEDLITEELLRDLKEKNYTRIPIFEGEIDNIVGILNVKDLLGVKTGAKISKFIQKNKFFKIGDAEKLDNLLNAFIEKRIHIAIVYGQFGAFQGIVTLEDIIEEILQQEVYDEGDKIADPRKVALKNARNLAKGLD